MEKIVTEEPDPAPLAEPGWHGWGLVPESAVLELRDPRTGNLTYEVDLEQCRDSAEVLDWVVQVSHKVWDGHGMAGVVFGLVQALDRIIGLQRRMCGDGVGKSLTAAQVRDGVALYVGERSGRFPRPGDAADPPAFWYH